MKALIVVGLLLLFWGVKALEYSNLVAWAVCIVVGFLLWPKKEFITQNNQSIVRTSFNVVGSMLGNFVCVILTIAGFGSAWVTFVSYLPGERGDYYPSIIIGAIAGIIGLVGLSYLKKKPH